MGKVCPECGKALISSRVERGKENWAIPYLIFSCPSHGEVMRRMAVKGKDEWLKKKELSLSPEGLPATAYFLYKAQEVMTVPIRNIGHTCRAVAGWLADVAYYATRTQTSLPPGRNISDNCNCAACVAERIRRLCVPPLRSPTAEEFEGFLQHRAEYFLDSLDPL